MSKNPNLTKLANVPATICITRGAIRATELVNFMGEECFKYVDQIPAGTPLVVLSIRTTKRKRNIVEVLTPAGDIRWVLEIQLHFNVNRPVGVVGVST